MEIFVCYGGDFGFDLEEVVKMNDLMLEDVICIYIEGEYFVYMFGFVLGFLFLGGMFEWIRVLRKLLLRLLILVGLVGIVGM